MREQQRAATTQSDKGRFIEAVPDDLVDDIYAELGLLLNIDGLDDQANDWLTDIVSIILPLVGRVLLDTQNGSEGAQ